VLVLLERLLAEAEAGTRMHSVLEILLLQALALEMQGDRTGALAALGRALVLAEPEATCVSSWMKGQRCWPYSARRQQPGGTAWYRDTSRNCWR